MESLSKVFLAVLLLSACFVCSSCANNRDWVLLYRDILVVSEEESYLADIYVFSDSSVEPPPVADFHTLFFGYVLSKEINAFTLPMNDEFLEDLSKLCHADIKGMVIVVKNPTTINIDAVFPDLDENSK